MWQRLGERLGLAKKSPRPVAYCIYESVRGVHFYDFKRIPDTMVFKPGPVSMWPLGPRNMYRARMDSLHADSATADRAGPQVANRGALALEDDDPS